MAVSMISNILLGQLCVARRLFSEMTVSDRYPPCADGEYAVHNQFPKWLLATHSGHTTDWKKCQDCTGPGTSSYNLDLGKRSFSLAKAKEKTI